MEQRRESMSGHASGSSEWEDVSEGIARTQLDSYLKLAKESMEAVEKMSLRNFNNEQCDYLVDKLKAVVPSASSFLEISRVEGHRPCSSVDITGHVDTFKLLVALAYQMENFIQGCCNHAWLQAAMILANVPDYVSSVGFKLELCRVAFYTERGATESLSLHQVDYINTVEVEIVKKKASVDLDTLIDKVILELPRLGSEKKDLAIYLLHRLRYVKPIPLISASWDTNYIGKLFTTVRQTAHLGKGASGATVDRALWLGTDVAVKTFYGPENPEFMKEAETLAQLCHPNITPMFCSTMEKRKCSIIMELMDEDLHALMNRRMYENKGSAPFTILEVVDIILQISEGVNYLHQKLIAHRDLKTLNILVKRMKATKSEIGYVHVKVADFGLSKIYTSSTRYSNQTWNTGTHRWMAPEIINLGDQHMEGGSKYPLSSDVYSYGMVCFEVLTGDVPFPDETPNAVKRMVLQGSRPDLPAHCPPILKDLIIDCWNQEPTKRPSFAIICQKLKYMKYLLLTGAQIPPSRNIQEKQNENKNEKPEFLHPISDNKVFNSDLKAGVRLLTAELNYNDFATQGDCGFFQSKNTFEFLLASDNRDLFVIKKADTDKNNSMEVHILSSDSNYQRILLRSTIPICELDHSQFTFCLAANRDLFAIKRSNTGSKHTEVHILTKKSNYQVFSLQVGTALHETDDTWQFLVSGNNDLYSIKKQQTGTNSTEIHALTASSNYQDFGLQSTSGIPETGLEWDFFGLDSMKNVYAIKRTDVAPELYILISVSGYKEFVKITDLQLPKIDHSSYFFILRPQVINSYNLFVVKDSYVYLNTGMIYCLRVSGN